MSYYPAMLDLRGKKVLFVGGGWETEHKVRGLLEAGAKLTLISPFEHPELEEATSTGRIIWLRRGFLPGDVEGYAVVVSHPVNRFVNQMVAKECRERGAWLNAVDDPQFCDFILPSVHRQGDLTISISTGGAAPALGVRIKQRLAEEYGPEYAEYLRLLRLFRPIVAQTYPDDFEARKAAWYRMVDSAALELIRIGEPEAARQILSDALHNVGDPVGTQGLAS
ncbi:MAG: precorrin-2 dehydrogenase, partial [Meiothermus sp.]